MHHWIIYSLGQPVEQWSCNQDLVCTQPQPIFPQYPSTSIQGSITTPVIKTKEWDCYICSESFHRRQERDRHEKTHLPHFIHCPLPHCTWRGNRTHLFKEHWKQADHRPYHRYYGRAPKGSQIETYDPCAVLSQLRSGAISLSEAEDQAIFLVQVKGYELQQPNMCADPWGRLGGRSRKQASSRR